MTTAISQALLHEQRYRRNFLASDAKQSVVVIILSTLGLTAVARNDFVLLSGTATLVWLLASRVLFVAATLAAVRGLRQRTRPRQHDCAYATWGIALGLQWIALNFSRFGLVETQGPLLGSCATIVICFFALRGPLLWRGVAAAATTLSVLWLLWDSRTPLTPAARVTSTIVILSLNGVGVVSGRAFEEQRRKRFDAEMQEKAARRQLAQKVDELAEQKRLAETMARARTAFLAAMSHEFRTPMNAVVGFSELLLAMKLDSKALEYAVSIRESARGLLGMLNDVLDFAKIDADKLVLASSPFDLRALCQSIVAMLEPSVSARPVAIEFDMAKDVPACVLGDELRLRQVLVNLLSNATKFTEAGRVTLRVSAEALGSQRYRVSFSVEDTGMGMTPDVLNRLFQPFEQGDQGVTRRHEGTGLGLAISRRIVQTMGGDIHVESTLGQGSTFGFVVEFVETGPITPPTGRRVQELGAQFTILVVDDHPINRRVATALLERIGYKADVAEDGRRALVAVAQKEYDIVFMDLHMPGMSGLETTTKMHELLKGRRMPRIIAMTASVFEEDREACRQVGMDGFIAKPIDLGQLDAVLSRLAKSRSKPTAAPTPTAALDKEALANLRELEASSEPGFVASILSDFLQDAPDRIRRIRAALIAKNAKEVQFESHTLKSTCKSIGANELSSICARIEAAARAGELTHLNEWVDGLEAEFGRLEPVISREILAETK